MADVNLVGTVLLAGINVDDPDGPPVLLKLNADGTLTGAGGGGGAPTGAAGGELEGTYPNPTVATIHSGSAHHALSDTAPQDTGTASAGVATEASRDDHVHALSDHAHAGIAGDGGLNTKTVRIGHTWAISGVIAVPAGDTDFINPFVVSLPTGQTAKLVRASYKINSGTSATVKLTINGSDATGFTAISVTTTLGHTDPADVDLADNDLIALVVTAVDTTPTNMTFTVFIEYTV